MTDSAPPHSFSPALRLLLALAGAGLIIASFSIIGALSKPSQYVTASLQAAEKPEITTDLKNHGIRDFTHHLYLVGPIVPAGGEANRRLFSDSSPVLAPSVFSDAAGAVEVLANQMPLTADAPEEYRFNEPLHLLGWRTSENGFTLFAVAKSQQALQALLLKLKTGWQKTIFIQGLLLIGTIFLIFWCLNLSALSTTMLRAEQLWIVNLVFLVLYYSVLTLSGYPLLATVPQTLLILLLANVVFIPLAVIFRPRHAAPGHSEKEK